MCMYICTYLYIWNDENWLVVTTLWLFNVAIENGPVEIVDLPIDSMVDLSIVM